MFFMKVLIDLLEYYRRTTCRYSSTNTPAAYPYMKYDVVKGTSHAGSLLLFKNCTLEQNLLITKVPRHPRTHKKAMTRLTKEPVKKKSKQCNNHLTPLVVDCCTHEEHAFDKTIYRIFSNQ